GGLLVLHLVGELDEHLEVVEAALDLGDALEIGLLVAERAGHLLRLLGVVPEVGGAGLLAQSRDVRAQGIDVDDLADVAEGVSQGLDVGGEIEFEHGSPAYRAPAADPRPGCRARARARAERAASPAAAASRSPAAAGSVGV